jgi:hypothetical protein
MLMCDSEALLLAADRVNIYDLIKWNGYLTTTSKAYTITYFNNAHV